MTFFFRERERDDFLVKRKLIKSPLVRATESHIWIGGKKKKVGHRKRVLVMHARVCVRVT